MPSPIRIPLPYYTTADAATVGTDFKDALIAGGGDQVVKELAWDAVAVFPIPLALNADYIAATQSKKQRMAEIAQEVLASGMIGTDFDTAYTAQYNIEFP